MSELQGAVALAQIRKAQSYLAGYRAGLRGGSRGQLKLPAGRRAASAWRIPPATPAPT